MVTEYYNILIINTSISTNIHIYIYINTLQSVQTDWQLERNSSTCIAGEGNSPIIYTSDHQNKTKQPETNVQQKLGYLVDFMVFMWMFPKMVVPPNHPFSYKPSILGCPYFWKHPCKYTIVPWILQVWFPLTKSLHSWLHWKSVPTDRLAPKTTKSPAGVRSFSNDLWFYVKNQSWVRKLLEIHWIFRKMEWILLGCLRKLLEKRAHWPKSNKNSENFKVPEIRHICHSNPIQMIFSFPTINIYKQLSLSLPPKIRFHPRPGLKERKVEFQNQFLTIVRI